MKQLFHSAAMVFIAAVLFLIVVCVAFPYISHHNGHKNHGIRHGDLVLSHPWVRIRGKSARAGAGYVVIHNHGQADRLIAVQADIALETELHHMVQENDVMKMHALEAGIVLAPNAKVELQPGGLHMMLFGLPEGMSKRKIANLTLTFERAGIITLPAPINPDPLGVYQDQHGHQHH